MKTVRNSFRLTAVINGMTLRAQVIREGSSRGFFQFWDKDANTCKPSWEEVNGSGNSGGPVFYVEITDHKGHNYIPEPYNPSNASRMKLIWNGTEVTFGSEDSNHFRYNTEGVLPANTIKMWNTNGVTYYKIVKNIFNTGNDDNDTFYLEGQVRVQGNTMQTFRTETENVTVIQTASGGTSYHVEVEVTNIGVNGGTGTCTAHLFSSSQEQEVDNGVSYQWYNMTGSTATECSSQNGYSGPRTKTLTVPDTEVRGLELFRVDVTYDGKTYQGYGLMMDESDPYYIDIRETSNVSGHNYESIMEDETVTLQGVILDSDDNEVSDSGLTVAFTVKKADGTAATAGTDYTSNAANSSVSFTYDQVVACGGSVTGYATGEISNS